MGADVTTDEPAERSEATAIAASSEPVTRHRLVEDLRTLGVADGDVLCVHTSVRSLGWVPGGAQTVLLALLDAVGATGTLVFPTQTGHLSDPADWSAPPVPSPWIDIVRAELPAFDPALTPSRGMGALPECARTHPGAVRSQHPLLSFVAIGADATELMAPHDLTPALGTGSPLDRLEAAGGAALLLGVDHSSCTPLHLAEYRASWPSKTVTEVSAPIRDADGERIWHTWSDLELDEEDFPTLGAAYAEAGRGRAGRVGLAEARLDPVEDLVAFAVGWMAQHRR